MEFRVLGALEVWDEGERVEISGRLHPKILAGLLLNTGRTVSLSWLVDLLWDNDPPATAKRQVQNAVAALRRQLDPVRGDLVERVGQDYRVNIAEDELDLRRFEMAAREARRLAESAQWDSALEGFKAALALWRGPALRGLSGRVLEAAATRLDDMYLSTYEDFAEATLAIGEPERVIPKLQELITAHPLRQRLNGRLMHALHQARRTTEALRLYDDFHASLADELGLDPGSELKNLHVRILQDDPALTPSFASSAPTDSLREGSASAAPQARTPVPAQLPTDVATFTGRDEHLTALDRLRDSGVRAGVVSAITGIGGVGKTALAVHWGHGKREDFPDGQLYINLRGFDEREPLTSHEAISRLLRSLGQPDNGIPAVLDEAAALYRSLLADKRMLVVLDNARTVDQVRALLPGSSGSLALVTSRNRLASLVVNHDAQQVELDTLGPGESLDLLANVLGAGALADIESSRRVCDLCGHLPLALRIVAANLAQNPGTSMAALVTTLEGEERLSRLNIGDDKATDITAVFNLSYRALSRETRQVFDHLGLIPGDDFTPGLAAAIMDRPTVDGAFTELVAANMLDQHESGRFRFHDLVRLYASGQAARLSDEVAATATVRLIAWYGERANLRMREFSNIIATCDAFQDHDDLRILIRALRRLATEGSDIKVSRQCAERALRAADESGDLAAKIDILTSLGVMSVAGGDNAAGIEKCRAAVALLPRVDDVQLHADVLGILGNQLYASGTYVEALEYMARSLAISEETGNQYSVLVQSNNIGSVYRALGRFDEAREHLLRARAVAEGQERPSLLAAALISVASLYLDMGDYVNALVVARQSHTIATEANATRIVAMAMRFIGLAQHARGQSREGLECLEVARDIFQNEHRVNMLIEILQVIAEVHVDTDDVDQAFAILSTAGALSDTVDANAFDKADHARISCRALTRTGEYEMAVHKGTLACGIFREQKPNPLRLAHSLHALGDAHDGNGDPAAALDCWNEALSIFNDLNVPEAPKLRIKLEKLPGVPHPRRV